MSAIWKIAGVVAALSVGCIFVALVGVMWTMIWTHPDFPPPPPRLLWIGLFGLYAAGAIAALGGIVRKLSGGDILP